MNQSEAKARAGDARVRALVGVPDGDVAASGPVRCQGGEQAGVDVGPIVGSTVGSIVGSVVGPTVGPAVGSTLRHTVGPVFKSIAGRITRPIIRPIIRPIAGPVVRHAVNPSVGPQSSPRAGPVLRTASVYLLVNVLAIPLVLVALALAMHRSGWDMRVASEFYDQARHGFPWRDAMWLEVIGHHLLKFVPIGVCLVAVGLALGSYVFPRWRSWRHAAWALAAALALGPAVVTQLKSMTVAHCPWDLREFGGYASFAADYAGSWWAPSRADAGRCLPSGHAGAGFCLLALYFFGWAAGSRRWRWAGLAIGIVAGMLFGFIRVVQGAHFPSHVMWSAVVCWLVAALVYLPVMVSGRAHLHA